MIPYMSHNLTLLNCKFPLKEQPDIKPKENKQIQRSACVVVFFSPLLAPSTRTGTEGNLDLTSLGGQHFYKKGLTTGNIVESNRHWNPAVTLTGLLSKQQHWPKWTADQQGKWITTWDEGFFFFFIPYHRVDVDTRYCFLSGGLFPQCAREPIHSFEFFLSFKIRPAISIVIIIRLPGRRMHAELSKARVKPPSQLKRRALMHPR